MSAHGVPTTGPRGARFRSRLEARWAAFFTLAGLTWEYEPDLGIGGWIPDFALAGKMSGLLVEVKPELSLPALRPHWERIERADGVRWPVWLVGGAFAMDVYGSSGIEPCVGWWLTRDANDDYQGRATWSGVLEQLGAAPKEFKQAQRLWVKAGNQLQWRRM